MIGCHPLCAFTTLTNYQWFGVNLTLSEIGQQFLKSIFHLQYIPPKLNDVTGNALDQVEESQEGLVGQGAH